MRTLMQLLLILTLLTSSMVTPRFAFAAPPAVGDTRAQKICEYAGPQKAVCVNCMKNGTSTWTALGCIDTDPSSFLGNILGIAIGVAGGIAFLLILFGGFQIITSAGNPEQLNAGRELVGSAITGLLFIIFSVFLLRFIGVSIFGIPGFK